MTTVVIRRMGKTSDKITEKAGNTMRQVRTHTRASDTSPKLKSLQDLSIRVNPEVTEEVMHHAGLSVNGNLHLHLHMCKVIHLMLKSSDPFHCALRLFNSITDVSL
jgi:predicted transcriptional regulator